MTQNASLISTEQLARIIDRPDVRLIDASWWLDGRDAKADFQRERIGNAVFFDLDGISDHGSALPHMLPSAEQFAQAVGQLGIRETDTIVIYDHQGLFSAARVWWMFRLMGAQHVAVLDGGFPKWKIEGRAVETSAPQSPSPATFTASPRLEAVAGIDDVRSSLGSQTQLLDARGSARFHAKVPEPRPGMRGGHMPGALNLPFDRLLNADKTMKGGPELEAAFQEVGLDLNRPVITTCGSGVTAAILTLGLHLLGKSARLYDGSWSEWGSREDTPIETD